MDYAKRTLGIPGVLHCWVATPRQAGQLLGRREFGDWVPHWAREEIGLTLRGVLAGRPPKKWRGYTVEKIGKERIRITRYVPDQKNKAPEGAQMITGSMAIARSASPVHFTPDEEL